MGALFFLYGKAAAEACFDFSAPLAQSQAAALVVFDLNAGSYAVDSASCKARHITFPLPLLGRVSANCTCVGAL